jgi:hypothetical protein
MNTEVVYVVDRIEGDVAVLVDEKEHGTDVPVDRFQVPLEEGLVLRVPVGDKGIPQWGKAEPDRRATEARDAEEAMNRLRSRDPGGDVRI